VQTYRTSNGTLEYQTLKTAPCSDEILTNQFFPVNQRFEKDAKFNIAKLKCLHNVNDAATLPGIKPRVESPIPIFGDYDTTETQTFNIFFSSCETLY
jgi:hypothetical protein